MRLIEERLTRVGGGKPKSRAKAAKPAGGKRKGKTPAAQDAA